MSDEELDLTDLPRIEVKPPVHDGPIRNIEEVLHESLSIHDRIANGVTRVVGSMPFVYSLVVFVALWMLTNLAIMGWHGHTFDQPWDFSVLLLISNQVQLLVPLFILVSQNRQQRRETLRAEQEYEIALRTELETEAMFDYLRQMADRQDVLLRILDLQQKRMLSMKESSREELDRLSDLMTGTLVSLVRAMELRPCLADVVEMDPEVKQRILSVLGVIGEESSDTAEIELENENE